MNYREYISIEGKEYLDRHQKKQKESNFCFRTF